MIRCVAERNIELLTLFIYKYDGHTVEDGKVVLTVHPTSAAAASGAAPVAIVATHLFRAEGFNVTIKSPFVLSVPTSPPRALALAVPSGCLNAPLERAHALLVSGHSDLHYRVWQDCDGRYLPSLHARKVRGRSVALHCRARDMVRCNS